MTGSIRGQILIDARAAIAQYAALRAANAATITALRSASATLIGIGVAAAAGGAALLGLFGKAVSAAATFEKKIDFFGAVTDATQAEMDAVAKKAIQMGQTTVFSANQMADAFVEFGKAGVSTKDLLSGVADLVVALAQAADISLTEASDVIISTMQTFKLSAKDTMHIADTLAGAANSSIIEITDLATSLKYVGGIAAATGIPLENVVTAIALLGQAGIKGSTAGTSLRQILVSLNATSGKAQKTLKQLGIITKQGTNLFIDQAGHLKPLDQVFQILQTHTAKLTDAQRLSALKIIFNNRALAAANILLKDGSKGFDQMSKSISKVSAVDVAHKRLDNLAGDFTRLKNTIQTYLIQAGTPFQNSLRTLVQGLTRLVLFFGRLPRGVQTALFAIIGIVGALLLLFGGISLVLGIALRIFILFRELGLVFKLFGGLLKALVLGFRALTLAMLSNPIILIIAAVIALGVAFFLLWKRSKTFRDIIKSIGNVFVTAFRAVVNFFKGIPAFFSGVWNSITSAVTGAWDKIVGTVTGAVRAVLDFLKKNWRLIISVLLGPLGIAIALISKFWDQITGFFSNAIRNVIDVIKRDWRIIILITGPFGIIVDILTAHWKLIYNLFVVGIQTVVNFVTNTWHVVRDVIVQGLSSVVSFVTSVWNGIVGVTRAVWNAVVTVLRPIINILTTIFRVQFNIIRAIVTAYWNSILAITRVVWAAVQAVIRAAVNTILAIARGIEAVGRFFRAAWDAAYRAVSTVIGQIIGIVRPIVSRILGAIGNVASALYGKGKDLMMGFFRGISDIFTTIENFFSGFISLLISLLGDVGSMLWDVGVQLMRGLIGGIKSMVGAAVDAVKSAVGGVVNGAKKLLGIGSPSKLFHQYGRWMMEGMANGIADNQKLVQQSIGRMVSSLNASAQVSSSLNASNFANRSNPAKFPSTPTVTVQTQGGNNTYHVELTVPVGQIKDVQTLMDIVNDIPRAAGAE